MNSSIDFTKNGAVYLSAPWNIQDVFNTPLFHTFVTILSLLLPLGAVLYIQHDYKSFLSLGPGGTPSTPLGYAKIKLLSLISLWDPLCPLPIPPHFRPQRGYLSPSSLPKRLGQRPIVRGIAPQRQKSQVSPQAIYGKLVESLKELTRDPSNDLLERTSCFEKHSSGLFASTPITRTCGGEICHAHPSDGSMHTSLHPADAKLVIEMGWGERHPLAKGGWFRRFVPREFMLVYAPRKEEEVEIVLRVVKAGVWWVSGVDVERGGKDRRVQEVLRTKNESQCWGCRGQWKEMEKFVKDA
ncbi:hypothetical protein P154DRAFT_122633 [Amniculicola lignicola CBS 123094]|uniref:Luciferase domain-containing protein n=1 Tax=Amniculicola lignicola CBS 123094 TaxID=1392246 RepID=A0A6A5WYY8_9PLEO|nr:hypothetical protein P154DRAFT_122633 [Amniculicola lignicola CBS 123094]